MIQRIGVSCIIWDGVNNRIAMTHRTDKCRHSHNKWGLPGGAMEPEDDSIGAVARREVQEEVNLDIVVSGCLGIQQEFVEFPDEESVFWTDIVLACFPMYGRPLANNEPDKFHEVKWIALSDLANYDLAKISKYSIEDFLKHRFGRQVDIRKCMLIDE